MADQEKPKDDPTGSDKPKSEPENNSDKDKNNDEEKKDQKDDKNDDKDKDQKDDTNDDKEEEKKDQKDEDKAEKDDSKDRPKSTGPKETDDERRPESAKSRPPSSKSRPPSGRKGKAESEKPPTPEEKTPDTEEKDKPPSRAPSVQDAPQDQEKVPTPPSSARQTPRGRRTPQKDTERLRTPDTAGSTPRGSRNKGRTPDGAIATPPMTAKSTESKYGGLCDICPQLDDKKTEKAQFLCESCQQGLCLRCAKRHIETAVFSGHNITPMATTPEDEVTLGDICCRTHPKWTLGFYCHGCQQVACGLCISFNHGGNIHNIERAENLNHNKHILLARYEKLIRNEPSDNKKAVPPKSPGGRPVARLLWRRESARGATLKEEDQEDDPANLCGPCDVTFLPRGQVVVADRWNKCVKFFDEEGNNPSVVLSHVAPLRLCATPAGRVAVVDDYGGGHIKILHMEELAQKTLEELARMEAEKTRLRLEKTQLNADKQASIKTPDANSNAEQTNADSANNDEIRNKSRVENKGKDDTNEGDKENRTGNENEVNSNKETRKGLNSRGNTRGKTDMRLNVGDLNKEDSLIIDGTVSIYKQWKPTHIKRPWAIAVNKLGQWLVSEYEQYVRASVAVYHADGGLVRSFGGHGERDDQFDWPGYLVTDSRGRVIVSDYWSHALKVFDPKGKFVAKIGKGWGKQEGHLTFPKGVCVDSDDHILVVDSGNMRVCEFSPDGAFVRHVLTEADGLVDPEGIAFVEVKGQEEDFDSELGQLSGRSTNQKAEQQQQPVEEPPEVKAPQRRLAVTLSKGHEYGAVLVFSFNDEEPRQ